MAATLPVIILENIIDQIDAERDPGALASFALVSQELLPRSRFVLYSTLYITHTHRLNGIQNSLRFFPHLAELVTSIQISICRPYKSDERRNCDASLHNMAPARLRPYLSRRTCSWTFIGISDASAWWLGQVHSFRAHTIVSLKEYSIHLLCLMNVEFVSLNEYANVIMACRSLSTLHLGPSIKPRLEPMRSWKCSQTHI